MFGYGRYLSLRRSRVRHVSYGHSKLYFHIVYRCTPTYTGRQDLDLGDLPVVPALVPARADGPCTAFRRAHRDPAAASRFSCPLFAAFSAISRLSAAPFLAWRRGCTPLYASGYNHVRRSSSWPPQ